MLLDCKDVEKLLAKVSRDVLTDDGSHPLQACENRRSNDKDPVCDGR